jgi:CheY-like chemotaxis protein/anti-sigma regulatory factor (Ser/Thr protein kinase)
MMVTRRKEAELARLAAAEEASRLKDEFLATLSHELRTPLNAILGWTHMVLAGDLPPDRVRHAIEIIGRNARLQAQLVADILDVSRIITGKLELDREPLLVPQLVDYAIAGVLPAAEAGGIRLERIVPGDLPPIEGDPKRLQQVLGNVLSNAVKFTPRGGSVEIRCALSADTIEVAVRDSGAGIPREFLPYVFDRFRQEDSRSTRKHGGLGLGLAIARHLLELHGGAIEAHSDGPGCGTTVIIRLPAGASVDAAGPQQAPVHRSLAPVDVRLVGSTVIVVDDQRDSREWLGALLEHHGATVVRCACATSAVEALARAPADLLVADIAMPDVDGYELIGRVRRTHPRLPALAVSAYARPQDRSQALAAGYDGYCAKPIETSEFLHAVREILPAG